MILVPPSELFATVSERTFNLSTLSSGLPSLDGAGLTSREVGTRRGLLKMAGAMLGAGILSAPAHASSASQLIFSPEEETSPQSTLQQSNPGEASTGGQGDPLALQQQETLRLGEIPTDFWQRPRELWLRRQGTRDEVRIVYWKDGQLLPEGYWKACAMLRDVRANVMTTMDPSILDILRGIIGYYQAWKWPHPVVVTSGFRTAKTNNSLEGAARNSMHTYGRATDIFIPGIPSRDVGALGMHFRQGGVGFYPGRGFTHLDTGRLRLWVGR